MPVPARISLVTLAVADVPAATAFYEAWGWRLSPSSIRNTVSFLDAAGARLALYGRADLARDVGVPAEGSGFGGVTMAINLEDEDEVDAAYAAAEAAGATAQRRPARTEWGGYSGYVTDLDGHPWEIAYNPGWPLDDDGLPLLP